MTSVLLSSIGAIFGSSLSYYFSQKVDAKRCEGLVDDYTCQEAYYLSLNPDSSFLKFMGVWVLVFTNFVPISLNISVDIVKMI